MRSEASPHWLVVQVLTCLVAGAAVTQNASGAAPEAPSDAATVLQSAVRQLAEGRPGEAAAALESLISANPPGLDRLTACTAAGQAASRLGDHAGATRFYLQAIDACGKGADTSVLRLAAAGAALRCGQLEVAIEQSRSVLGPPADGAVPPAAVHRTMACRVVLAALMAAERLPEAVAVLRQAGPDSGVDAATLADAADQLAARCLSQGHPGEAMAAYQWYLERIPSGAARDRAELGIAWSAALGAEAPEQAAARLESFCDAYPEHADVPRALRAAAACWTQAGHHDQADRVRRSTIQRWPRSAAAATAIDELSAAAHDDRSDDVCAARRDLLLQPTDEAPLGAASVAAAIRDAAVAEDEACWKAAAVALVEHAHSGVAVADALQRLTAADRPADAERLAVHVLGNLGQPGQSAAAVEATCRWAADAGRWTMVALAAEGVDPTAAAELSATAAGWIAESLVQTSRGKLAQAWLDLAVERLHAGDFRILIRRAELSVAFDPLDVAEERVAAAAKLADDKDEQTLLAMLRAEISIRRARLEEAREALEHLVRGDQATAELRCRAQWLIGETFLLQERPAEAVEAYRRVESMDPTGHWTAAALVQAGRAFEQLGRQREATLCYVSLVQRFADSPHAATAHGRLAVIGEQPKRR